MRPSKFWPYRHNSSWNVKDALLLAAASVGLRRVAAGGSVGAGPLTTVVVGRAVIVGVIIAPVGVGVCCRGGVEFEWAVQ